MNMLLSLLVGLIAGLQFTAAAPVDLELAVEHAMIEEFDKETSSPHGLAFSGSDVLPLKEFFNIRDWPTIQERSQRSQAKTKVNQKMDVYYSINPTKAMTELTEVGSLLRLAYSGSKGFKCSTPILEVMSSYQDLIKDSLIVTSTFVEIVIKALKYHKYSVMFAAKKKMELSIKYLRKCSIMAGRMADESQALIDKSDKLIDLAVDALLTANNDYTGSIQERQRIEKFINETRVERARQEQIKKDLTKSIAEEKKKEKENAALATESSGWGIFVKIITIGIVDIDGPKKEAAAKQAELARQARIAFQKKERENNAAMAETVTKLLQSANSQLSLEKAILGLDITIKTMGKVKTIFLNAKTFWVGIKKHTQSLAASQEQLDDLVEDEDFHEEYVEEVADSGYSWLALGKICRDAAVAIREVNKDIDQTMRNIPTEAEAKGLIKTLGEKILKGLKEDNADIERELSSTKNQPKKTTR